MELILSTNDAILKLYDWLGLDSMKIVYAHCTLDLVI